MVTIREPTLDDAAGIARVHVASSEDAYRPLAGQWDAPDVAERTRDWATWLQGSGRVDRVAVVDGEIVGFASAGKARDDAPAGLELFVIHVLPGHRGRGVGGRLWAAACGVLRGQDLGAMFLRTFGELPCCRFYEARGGEVVVREPGDFDGGPITDVVYRWARGQSHAAGPYALRPATRGDFEFLYAVKREAHREHVAATYGPWDEAWQRDRFAAKLDLPAVQVVIAAGEPVGALSVDWAQDPVFLSFIELRAAHRGKGIGTAIIRDILGQATAVRLQVFKVNPDARRLYERLGFEATGTTDTHVEMRWSRG